MKHFLTLIFIALLFSCNSNVTSELLNKVIPPDLASAHLYKKDEFALMQQKFTNAQAELQKDKTNMHGWKVILDLNVFQGRVSGDHVFSERIYDITTDLLKYKNLKLEDRFLLLSYRATALLSLHEFQQALDVATEASALIPENATIIGAMVDANVELGNYKEAVSLTDKMVRLRPDLRSYSRVSYIRELHGDLDGAIAAMKEAVASCVGGNESCEWARVMLGKLYAHQQKYDYAKMYYTIALENRPDFYPALEALSKLHIDLGQINEASSAITKMESVKTSSELYALKAQYFKTINDVNAMNEAYENLLTSIDNHKIDLTNKASKYLVKSKLKEMQIDHAMKQVALETAKYMIDIKADANSALPFLEFEYKIRPKNIEVNKYLAAAYQLIGDKEKMKLHLQRAMMTGWKDADLARLNEEQSNHKG